MRNLLFLLFLFFSLNFTAQGNLQFNQVLRIHNIAQTVPASKVWKIESYMQSQTALSDGIEMFNCNYLDRHHSFLINTKPYFLINGSPGHGSSGTFMAVGNQLPIWLKAGDIVQTTCVDNFLSILEFNIIP